MNRVISLCGPKGSGKSTIAAWLVAERGFEEISLAKPLKAFARTIFGRVLSEEDCWGPSAVRERKFSSREKQELHRSFQARTTFLRLDAEGRQMLKDLFGERIGIDGSEIRAPALFGPREAAVAFQAAFEPFEEAFHSPRMILQRLGTEWGRTPYGGLPPRPALRDPRRALRERGPLPARPVGGPALLGRGRGPNRGPPARRPRLRAHAGDAFAPLPGRDRQPGDRGRAPRGAPHRLPRLTHRSFTSSFTLCFTGFGGMSSGCVFMAVTSPVPRGL